MEDETRRAVRRRLFVFGTATSLAMLVSGLTSGWLHPLVTWLVITALFATALTVARSRPEHDKAARRPMAIAFALSVVGVVPLVILSRAHPSGSIWVLAALVVFLVWTLVAWRVGRAS